MGGQGSRHWFLSLSRRGSLRQALYGNGCYCKGPDRIPKERGTCLLVYSNRLPHWHGICERNREENVQEVSSVAEHLICFGLCRPRQGPQKEHLPQGHGRGWKQLSHCGCYCS